MWKPFLGFIMLLSFFFINVQPQETSENLPEMPQTLHPSKGIVIAVLTIMFAISFFLLAYVKFCRTSPFSLNRLLNRDVNFQGLTQRASTTYSGIDKQVIEALPFFKFSSLKGSKQGLECCVCLSKFEDTEVLRLLPKCKHGFHMNCIDKWLETHSTCPLCRYRVDPADIKAFTCSISSRFLQVPSNLTQDPTLEIFVQREESRGEEGSSKFSSFWNIGERWKLVHSQQRVNHKIVISDTVATRSRWSDLNSSDLLSLNCEMLNDVSGRRVCGSKEEENWLRSMSEIANVARFEEKRMKELGVSTSSGYNGKEERLRKMWLAIVERTVKWFAGGDRSLREMEHKLLTV
ncbi:putative RING-H2 finger protein ATL12 [Senna tora]|uniref:RING-type E3 ubiquitin transferase n=1 Tax=Senna tora TaxID=362788 RepID=A0A834WDL3_9FABA|nr:putative RING-H2 finger protein ATL12 [Senna tora]